MTISVIADNKSVEVKHVRFSDGGSNPIIKFTNTAERFVSVTIKDEPVDSYLYLLSVIGDIVRAHSSPLTKRIINLPYLPHGRADRVFEDGAVCPLDHIWAQLCMDWDEIILYDVHNIDSIPEYLQTICTVRHNSQLELMRELAHHNSQFKDLIYHTDNVTLVAPDKGAKDKCLQAASDFSLPMVQMHKVRDPSTGEIHGVEICNDGPSVAGMECIIVDDICDGGRTFVEAARKLKQEGAKKVYLYVSHGIFSKGLDVFKGELDGIFCWHIVMNYVTQINLDKFNKEINAWNI